MKKYLSLIVIYLIIISCQQQPKAPETLMNPNYDTNLANAKKFFSLFSNEDVDGQIPLICPGVTHYPPFYGSEPNKYDDFITAGKAWMENFDEITYTAEAWLPGTDTDGILDGSVITFGSWSAKSVATGNVISNRAFHSFKFNGAGQIHEIRDYMDASGIMAAAMKTE